MSSSTNQGSERGDLVSPERRLAASDTFARSEATRVLLRKERRRDTLVTRCNTLVFSAKQLAVVSPDMRFAESET